ncbi:MAG TPA: sigma-70 family RNA polymerase sigma factor [Candidatus Angelobacter sp.]|jgi:RNA polymerase sigma-70 factor (ECF subfamily)|nr:sigma-70 family RNA polymerase sigma factor [Candidatus Angelobacter sp.]
MASNAFDLAIPAGDWQKNLSAGNYHALPIDDLLQQCAENTADFAWREFVQRFDSLITGTVRRTCREWPGTSPDIVEDLIQETYLKLCANNFSLLVNFQFRHPNSFLGCIKTVATNVVYDYFRSAHAFKRDMARNVDLDHAINHLHEGDGEEKWLDIKILMDQVDALLQQCNSGPGKKMDRKIFWLYYHHGLTAKAIAMSFGKGMTTKSVEGTIARLTKFVKRELQYSSK